MNNNELNVNDDFFDLSDFQEDDEEDDFYITKDTDYPNLFDEFEHLMSRTKPKKSESFLEILEEAKHVTAMIHPAVYFTRGDANASSQFVFDVAKSSENIMSLLEKIQAEHESAVAKKQPFSRAKDLDNQLSATKRELESARRHQQDLMMQVRLLESVKKKEIEAERKRFEEETAEMRKKLEEYERVRPMTGQKRAVVDLSHLPPE